MLQLAELGGGSRGLGFRDQERFRVLGLGLSYKELIGRACIRVSTRARAKVAVWVEGTALQVALRGNLPESTSQDP